MDTSHLSRCAVSAVASLVVVAGCGGLQPTVGASSGITQSRGVAAHVERVEPGMFPQANGDLMYVSQATSGGHGTVYVFSYPDGRKVGTLIGIVGIADDVCSGPFGHVFVTEYSNVIQEYARGRKLPIATLDAPGEPEECSVDSTSGNLAVGIYTYNSHPTGVAVYRHAHGSPMFYTDSSFSEMTACSYDDNGNLFAAGVSSQGGSSKEAQLALAELPAGGSNFVDIKLKKILIDTVNQHIEWYGGKLAIGEGARYATEYAIYQMAISGARARLVGETQLDLGGNYVNADTAFSIQGGRIAVTVEGSGQYTDESRVLLWPYPKGGGYTSSTKPFGTQNVGGVTVSIAHHR
jgi:hypothetical protein